MLSEMRQFNLPRSLLCASERCMDFAGKNTSAPGVDIRADIAVCVSALVDACLKEAQTSLGEKGIATLLRVAVLIQKLHDAKPELGRVFARGLDDVLSSLTEATLKSAVAQILSKLGTSDIPTEEGSTATPETATLKSRLANVSISVYPELLQALTSRFLDSPLCDFEAIPLYLHKYLI
jgi:hypothetical protein